MRSIFAGLTVAAITLSAVSCSAGGRTGGTIDGTSNLRADPGPARARRSMTALAPAS